MSGIVSVSYLNCIFITIHIKKKSKYEYTSMNSKTYNQTKSSMIFMSPYLAAQFWFSVFFCIETDFFIILNCHQLLVTYKLQYFVYKNEQMWSTYQWHRMHHSWPSFRENTAVVLFGHLVVRLKSLSRSFSVIDIMDKTSHLPLFSWSP